MPLALVLIAGGGLLLIGAIRNEHPWAALMRPFGGTPPPPPGEAAALARVAALSPGSGGAAAGAPSSVGIGSGAGSTAGGADAAALICTAGGWPPTPGNLAGLNAWVACEKPAGQPWQWNNPLNTTDRFGSSSIAAVGPGISVFPTPGAGALANARTIKGLDGMRGWPAAEAALRSGTLDAALRSNADAVLGGWGTNPSCVSSRLASRGVGVPTG